MASPLRLLGFSYKYVYFPDGSSVRAIGCASARIVSRRGEGRSSQTASPDGAPKTTEVVDAKRWPGSGSAPVMMRSPRPSPLTSSPPVAPMIPLTSVGRPSKTVKPAAGPSWSRSTSPLPAGRPNTTRTRTEPFAPVPKPLTTSSARPSPFMSAASDDGARRRSPLTR